MKPGRCSYCACPVLKRGEAAVMPEFVIGEECEVLSPGDGHLACTREPNHPGDHVACGMHFHEVERWPR